MDSARTEIESRLGRVLDEVEELYSLVVDVELETSEEWNRLACRVADQAAELKTVVLCAAFAARGAAAPA